MSKKKTFYNYKKGILQHDFDYNFIVGGRSNGKTTGFQRDVALENFLKDREQFVKVVRTNDDTVPLLNEKWIDITVEEKLKSMGLKCAYFKKTYYIGTIEDYTEYGLRTFCTNYAEVWGYVIPLSQQARYKSSDRSKVSTIVFDEFAIKETYMYLPDEVEQFMSLVSTIIRSRDNVKVFFIGNALSLKNPYFTYFGINASKLKSGNVYSFVQCGDEFKEYAKVGLDFVPMIYNDESEIPKLLRVTGNAQATTLDKYVLPNNIITENDWLYFALKNDKFFDYYSITECIAWIKDEQIDIENVDFEKKPKFISVYEIVYKYDENVRYLIKNEKDSDYGLSLDMSIKKPTVKIGKDIRLKLPNKIFEFDKSSYVLGTTDLIDMLEQAESIYDRRKL